MAKILIKTLIVLMVINTNFSVATIAKKYNNKINSVKKYLSDNKSRLGLSDQSINDAKIKDAYQSKHNGMTHFYFKQTYKGIELHEGNLQVHLNTKDEVVVIHNQFVKHVSSKIFVTQPKINAPTAIISAFNSQNIMASIPELLVQDNNTIQSARYKSDHILHADIPVKLTYKLNTNKVNKLSWNIELQLPHAWLSIWIDAENGQVIDTFNFTLNESYEVVPHPFESPTAENAIISLVTNVADDIASPFGWHDTNGEDGAEFTTTEGNNVSAQDDLNGNNFGGIRPDGGEDLIFDFAFDENLQPTEGENLEFAIVNLFYWNNIIHDIMYQYGFDEEAGNFQENNYGNGGSGSDSVNADAQDGAGNNNANFSTPPDGQNPRMQMFTFLASPDLTVSSPKSVAGEYVIGGASFGAEIDALGISGVLEEVNDTTGNLHNACDPLVGFTAGKIALLDRGDCQFGVKVLHAQQAGAIAALVINNQGDAITTMGPGTDGDSVTIPSAFIGQTIGNILRAEVDVTISLAISKKDRDGDLDNGIVIHEYGHGISNRLVAGPNNTFCLGNEEQMGEGWSDFFAMVLTTQTGFQGSQLRPMGTYASNNPSGGRQFPYTTNLTVNSHTLASLSNVTAPHGVGSVWAVMLWEVYWNLVNQYGFDDDMYNGNGGNNIMLQLVIDALKITPCDPSFIQARDALLTADTNTNNGDNSCLIWAGFAKRGVGVSASSGNGDVLGDETEDFTVPVECLISDLIYSNGFE